MLAIDGQAVRPNKLYFFFKETAGYNGGPALRIGFVRGRALRLFLVLKKYCKLFKETFTWENVHLGSCRFSFMGKLPIGKLSFGKMCIRENVHLGSYA